MELTITGRHVLEIELAEMEKEPGLCSALLQFRMGLSNRIANRHGHFVALPCHQHYHLVFCAHEFRTSRGCGCFDGSALVGACSDNS